MFENLMTANEMKNKINESLSKLEKAVMERIINASDLHQSKTVLYLTPSEIGIIQYWLEQLGYECKTGAQSGSITYAFQISWE